LHKRFIVGKNLGIAERQVAYMPQVTIKTGIAGPDGREEELTEYLCDLAGLPECRRARTRTRARELGLTCAVCQQHATTSRDADID
jgi:hypothetical protein